MNDNPFKRFAYSPYDTSKWKNGDLETYSDQLQTRTVFTGGDLHAYVNNIPVKNLESCTWSISVEVVGNYVMGRRDAVVYTTGKRVVVGTLVFSQYNQHAFIEEVFHMGSKTYSDMWKLADPDNSTGALLQNDNQKMTYGTTVVKGVNTDGTVVVDGRASSEQLSTINALGLRGLSQTQFNEQLKQQLRETARLVGSTKINYSDQIPPFDLTLIGVTKNGEAAKCSIFGIQITQETAGFSSSDLSNATGLSFVALAVDPWKPVNSVNGTVYFPPSG